MFRKVLIANRGEIALRVIRACKELGIATVAVHSTADAESLHVRFADEAICIGPPQSRESYLNVRALLAAADVSGADAIHPGYGFLSENAEFAEMVTNMGLKFIGPRPEMLRLMGNKVKAREAMEKAGLPLLPGARGVLRDGEEAERIAKEIGFPVILKAASGGGGRGMKIVRDASMVKQMFDTASAEALAAFGDGSMYLERYVEQPRHIELQIVADEHGSIIHLGERECSVQRRHQKLIEESPSPAVNAALRREMGEVALEAMRKVGYNNVGTIEFLMDEKGRYYFMEMNTRIQVEHPVTEQVYGLDLLREQIRLAAGEKLERNQAQVVPIAHAIECRVNAEDPVTFAPSPGKITGYHQPGGYGVRVDTMAYEQYKVQPYYDSLVAKLIVTGATRDIALQRMMRALNEYVIEGIKTNIPFHKRVLAHPAFVAGHYDTRLVEQILNPPSPAPEARAHAVAAR
ncbi:MAG TPA: acetyl-CoA carboxylase biotin carboxylase subunit [Anaeromyxobacteraceae bacterium]|nr:acetyl-CoA carboxylase biotin carboxylase subunit [Anaeromyxobacteraceae bacterium]